MPKATSPYDPVSLKKALDEVINGGKIREIARKYGVPKSTLHFKLKHPDNKTTFGPSPYLTLEEEICLENWIIELSKKGFPLKKEDLQSSVKKFLSDNPRTNPFKDNYPGEGWVRGFLKRHPTIAQRTSEGVTFSSACVSESDIRKWFAEIHQYFAEKGLLEVLDDPKRVFNGDESGFQLCPKTGKVLAIKGMKNVYSVETSSSKENMTVMFTFSAAGQCCPPMIIYNYQRIPQKVVESVPSDWGVGRSENGWMTSEVFFEYIANVFHPYLLKENIPLPVIYFLDGHKTHLTYEVSKLCTELQIELIALYPNATRILQPADVAVFRPVKSAWKASVREWLDQHPGQVITKVNFAEVLNVALKKSIKAQTLINGFKACGLAPFSPDAVDYTKCLPIDKNANIEIIISHAPKNEDVITFSQFLSLIGPTKATELQNIVDPNQIDTNLRILLSIYNSFGPSNKTSVTTTSTDHQQSSENSITNRNLGTSNDDVLSQGTTNGRDMTPSPTLFQNYGTFNDDTCFNDDTMLFTQNEETCNDTLLQLGQTKTQLNPNHQITVLHEVSINQLESNPSYRLCPITGFITRSTSSPTAIEVFTKLEKTPIKQLNTIKPLQENDVLQPLSLTSEISPAFKVRSTDIGSYLTLPKTPERRGKRETKKMPFAITSAKYKAMYKEQIEKKESEQREKEERKRVREEAKTTKKAFKKPKLGENTKKNKNTIKSDTNACKICSKTTKVANRVTCDMCSSFFHVKCVPKKHSIHVPEDITMDLFVCHTCYKEDENDEIDENGAEWNTNSIAQIKSDDNDSSKSEENSEEMANYLFKEYLSSKKA